MTEVTNTAATQKADKVKKLVEMPQRQIFATPEEAENWLTNAGERYEDFGAFMEAGRVVIPRLLVDDEGNATLDREVYGQPGVATMLVAMANKNKKENGIKAIVVAPIPTLDAMLESAEGRSFVQSIINKELNHRAVRALRDAENVQSVADQVPLTLADYMASGREAGGLMEAYDELYKLINETLSKAVPAWQKRRFTKVELRKSLESKAYALDSYPEIEEAGVNGSLFEKAIGLGISAAKRKSLDGTIFQRWLDTRNEKTFSADEDEAEELELDLDSLTDAMLAEPEAEEPAATEPTA